VCVRARRRDIPVAAAAAERDHGARREEAEEALPQEVQQGPGALGGGHPEGARVRDLPRGQPQGRAARLRPHAMHALLRGLVRALQFALLSSPALHCSTILVAFLVIAASKYSSDGVRHESQEYLLSFLLATVDISVLVNSVSAHCLRIVLFSRMQI
jgi:hypothetical protein